MCFRVNIGFDIAVEDLQLSGTMQAILHMSMDVPFPHITKATMSFVEKWAFLITSFYIVYAIFFFFCCIHGLQLL